MTYSEISKLDISWGNILSNNSIFRKIFRVLLKNYIFIRILVFEIDCVLNSCKGTTGAKKQKNLYRKIILEEDTPVKKSIVKILALTTSMLVMHTAANAETADNSVVLDSYNINSNDCLGCGPVKLESEADFAAHLSNARAQIAQRFFERVNGKPVLQNRFSRFIERLGTQVVYLDFNSDDPTFPVCALDETGAPAGLFGIFNDHVYTQEERDSIQGAIEDDYADYNFFFTQEEPAFGEFTTITFAQNDAPADCSEGSNISITAAGGLSVLFGRADELDFGNRNKQSGAFTDVSIWEFLSQFAGGQFFELFANLDVANDFDGDIAAAVSFAVVNQGANTGAHELGHTLGLRHQNSFGAPGDGIPNTGAISPFDFVPVFEGPANADETVLHTMASGASVGLPFDGGVNFDRFFSERSATRLAINEVFDRLTQSEERNNGRRTEKVLLRRVSVPNTIIEGQNENAFLDVRARIVEGSMSAIAESDSYFVRARKGDFLNAELVPVISTGQSFEEGILGQVRVFLVNKDGTEELVGSNIRSFESLFDTEVFDIEIPKNGIYRIEVTAPDEVFLADFDGDGVIDPVSLTAAGAPELQTGEYSLLIFTCNKRLRRTRNSL